MNATLKKPLSVVRSAEAADAAIAALRGVAAPDQPDEAFVEDAEIAEAPASIAEAPASVEPPVETAPEQPAVAQPAGDEFTRLQQAHAVLQGKYTNEGRRDRETIAGLRRDLDGVRGLLAQLQTAAPAPVAPKPASLVTPKEVEEFGEDLLDAAGRYAAQQWSPLVEQLRNEIATLRADVATAKTSAAAAQTSVTVSARDRMFALLDAEITDWRSVNTDDTFKDWLAQEDEMSGETRQALLLKAYNRNDGPRVARFFSLYKAENTQGSASAPGTAPAAAPETPGSKTKAVDPAALVAPARGRSAPRSTGAQQIVWTPQDIRQFYDDVQKGRYKSNPTELARLEQDIFTAQRDGRVQVT